MLHLHSKPGFRGQPQGRVTSKPHQQSATQALCSPAAAMPCGHVSQSPEFCLSEHKAPPAVVRESSNSGACFRLVFALQFCDHYGISAGGVTCLICCSQPLKFSQNCRTCFRSCLPGAPLCCRRERGFQSGLWYEAACNKQLSKQLVMLLYSLSITNVAIMLACCNCFCLLHYLLSPQAPTSNLCTCQQSLHDLP